ncbi:hypothetical protein E2C01_032177 [Portunus trituberculatus]|uniref:Uncharacterized protein n=1 Tax=Portunus trituberculatus TaxID=210409 RepID=A0A5B7EZX0_PORTR|nr:hypothetical protein [Portunus trituberculatus]
MTQHPPPPLPSPQALEVCGWGGGMEGVVRVPGIARHKRGRCVSAEVTEVVKMTDGSYRSITDAMAGWTSSPPTITVTTIITTTRKRQPRWSLECSGTSDGEALPHTPDEKKKKFSNSKTCSDMAGLSAHVFLVHGGTYLREDQSRATKVRTQHLTDQQGS